MIGQSLCKDIKRVFSKNTSHFIHVFGLTFLELDVIPLY